MIQEISVNIYEQKETVSQENIDATTKALDKCFS